MKRDLFVSHLFMLSTVLLSLQTTETSNIVLPEGEGSEVLLQHRWTLADIGGRLQNWLLP